jgi:hypothetical protein
MGTQRLTSHRDMYKSLLAVLFSPGIGPTPVEGIEVTRPPWLYWSMFTLKNSLGLSGILWGAGVLSALLVAVPLIDRRPERRWRRRPTAMALGILVVAALVAHAAQVFGGGGDRLDEPRGTEPVNTHRGGGHCRGRTRPRPRRRGSAAVPRTALPCQPHPAHRPTGYPEESPSWHTHASSPSPRARRPQRSSWPRPAPRRPPPAATSDGACAPAPARWGSAATTTPACTPASPAGASRPDVAPVGQVVGADVFVVSNSLRLFRFR